MILPDAVHDDAPRERVPLFGDPLRQRRAARALRFVRTDRKLRRQLSRDWHRARTDFLRVMPHISSLENENRPRLSALRAGADTRTASGVDRAGIDDLWRW